MEVMLPLERAPHEDQWGTDSASEEERYMRIGTVIRLWQKFVMVAPISRTPEYNIGTVLYLSRGAQVLGPIHDVIHSRNATKYVGIMPSLRAVLMSGIQLGDYVYVRVGDFNAAAYRHHRRLHNPQLHPRHCLGTRFRDPRWSTPPSALEVLSSHRRGPPMLSDLLRGPVRRRVHFAPHGPWGMRIEGEQPREGESLQHRGEPEIQVLQSEEDEEGAEERCLINPQ